MNITNEQIYNALGDLMGINGDEFADEIITTGKLSYESYCLITNNVAYNGPTSVLEHFGLVQWFYYQGIKSKS